MQQQKNRFPGRQEEEWRTFFARERYFSSHVPRAARTAHQGLLRCLSEAIPSGARA